LKHSRKGVDGLDDLVRFCDSVSVLPLWISETGHVNELPTSVLVCSSLGRFSKGVPEDLVLIRKYSDGTEVVARYSINPEEIHRMAPKTR